MEESIKKIITSVLIMLVSSFIILFYINNFRTSLNKQNLKGIGIDSRTINIDIVDNKIICEDVLLFDINSEKEISYSFLKEYKYLDSVKIYINNTDNFYSSNLKKESHYKIKQ